MYHSVKTSLVSHDGGSIPTAPCSRYVRGCGQYEGALTCMLVIVQDSCPRTHDEGGHSVHYHKEPTTRTVLSS